MPDFSGLSHPAKGAQASAPSKYWPPTSGFLSYLPTSWVPYGELARVHRPVGAVLFYFPHLFGTIYATSVLEGSITFSDILLKNTILLSGAFFVRSAACVWNDNIDRDYDKQVARCRLRPIARGAVSRFQAHVFTIALAVTALFCLALLPISCWVVSIPIIFLIALYPFAKRFTDFPQVILGIKMALGFYMGFAAMDTDAAAEDLHTIVYRLSSSLFSEAMVAFYISNVCWTVGYDTTYAQQDVEDDVKAGVKSMAVKFRGQIRGLLWMLAASQVTLLVVSGHLEGFGLVYKVMAGGGTAMTLIYMLTSINLAQPRECAWWFQYGSYMVSAWISLGLIMEISLSSR